MVLQGTMFTIVTTAEAIISMSNLSKSERNLLETPVSTTNQKSETTGTGTTGDKSLQGTAAVATQTTTMSRFRVTAVTSVIKTLDGVVMIGIKSRDPVIVMKNRVIFTLTMKFLRRKSRTATTLVKIYSDQTQRASTGK